MTPTAAPAQSVAVYLGSSPHPEYEPLAEDIGRQLARRGVGVVYGGGDMGLMGAFSRGAHEAGAAVTGVAPAGLFSEGRTGPPLGELLIVSDIAERQELMCYLGDSFLALPGGFGTQSELWRTIEKTQHGIHKRSPRKAIALLNWPADDGTGFYDGTVIQLDQFRASGFITEAEHALITVTADTATALDAIGVPPERAAATSAETAA